MESDLSSSSFSIDNILKPDKCDSSQEPRSADRALTLAERLAGEYGMMNACFSNKAALCHSKLHRNLRQRQRHCRGIVKSLQSETS